LKLTASQPTALPGDLLSLTLAYTNTGAASVASAALTLRLPSDLVFDGDPCGVLTGCSSDTDGKLTLTPGVLLPGVGDSLTIRVAVKPGVSGKAAVGLAADYTDVAGAPFYATTAAVVHIP
jgi:hypothetical protein